LKKTHIAIVGGESLKGSWQSIFACEQPIHIEIGMGKGQFINGMAKLHPEINFIGVEKYDSVLIRSLEKAVEEPLPNLRLLHADAANLLEIFAENEIEQIYLNFSDPWPKVRHEKRRLTYKSFLENYKHTLVPEGRFCLKTDNRLLFEYSLWSFNDFGMRFLDVCLDLHADGNPEGNIMTEYEEKFHGLGHPIYRFAGKF